MGAKPTKRIIITTDPTEKDDSALIFFVHAGTFGLIFRRLEHVITEVLGPYKAIWGKTVISNKKGVLPYEES